MYETYFDLIAPPFTSVPRTDHYYPASVIDEGRKTLTRCVERGEGVAMIVGPSGTGKSLLCQILAEQLQAKFQVALLASTHLDTRRSLLQAILYELNRPYRGMDEGELRLSLVDYVTLSDDCSHGVVLVVDEAHHLPLRLLDEIRSLTNLMRNLQPAVRLLLAGSHVLEERFASPKLESFSQRISARCYLEAFQRSETQAYIQSRISACGGSGAEIFPAETCQMVHKATDGVPRLINQVCDHVLLLAYAAGVRRIEPAHVEEAWADLQQLPTPWNAPAVPAGDSVIEFGGLDDSPLELPPIAGKIAADEETCNTDYGSVETSSRAEASVLQPTLVAETRTGPEMKAEDAESFEQLRHIQTLLADVQAEFQPARCKPEVELIFDAPHPFAEPFAEEEVIADRYAAVASQPKPTLPAMQPAPCVAAAAAAEEAEPVGSNEGRDEPQPETISMPHDRKVTRQDVPEAEVAAATVAPIAEEPASRPKRSVVPPPRQEFGRLFAKLRRGL